MVRSERLHIFSDFETAIFARRLNRFIVECFHNGNKIKAYLPNPGRLWELLQEHRIVYITKRSRTSQSHMEYTVIAVHKDGVPVFLHTHHTNTVAGWLIKKQKIPGLEGYSIEKPEYAIGKSRFDFLLKKGKERMLLEVKSCTLFHEGMAMFPDAVTDRGRRHITDIANSSLYGGVLFVVHSPSVEYFLPEYHIDPEFSKTLYSLRNDIFVKAISVMWNQDLSVTDKARELKIPWETYEKEAADCGSYMLILNLNNNRTITVGRLGELSFKKGYYIYVGSAMQHLTKRIERHKRTRKNLFWHIDYLREQAQLLHALPIRSSLRLECHIASALKKISDESVNGFGAGDCDCGSHLFYMNEYPIKSHGFVDLLLHYRMTRISIRPNTDQVIFPPGKY